MSEMQVLAVGIVIGAAARWAERRGYNWPSDVMFAGLGVGALAFLVRVWVWG